MSETPDELTRRPILVYLDSFKRTCIGEIVEDLDELYMLKAPAFLNSQLVPQTGPDGKPQPDPRNPGKPLLAIHTMWVPLMYAESLADREAGFVIPIEKKGLTVLDGILRPNLTETYRVNTMGEGKVADPAAPQAPGGDEPIPLFGGEE